MQRVIPVLSLVQWMSEGKEWIQRIELEGA
jgi:hypothetical protein